MWYYAKGSRKVGPVAEVALRALYSSGGITGETLVWSRGMKQWKPLRETPLLPKFTKKISQNHWEFKLKTKFFRALLTAYAALSLSFVFLNYKRMNYFDAVVFSDDSSSKILECVGVEYHKISAFTSIVLFVVFLILLKTAFNWIYLAAQNTALWRKEFIVSPTYVAWSIFIPIVNFVQPFKFLKYIYKYSKIFSGKRYTIYDTTYLLLWWFFSLFSFFVFILNNFLFPAEVTSETVFGILVFRMYYCAVLVFTLLFWISFVSRVYRYQIKALSRF